MSKYVLSIMLLCILCAFAVMSCTQIQTAVERPVFMRRAVVVKLGIEVLVGEQIDLIRGKKVGLITNPSAVTSDLKSSIDVLANTEGVELAALFGAEHGVRGAKQGKIVQEGEPDPATGIPVYSLYGDSYFPKAEWLENLDVLIFDIQGVGSAWYTFKYTMSYAMEAAAKAGLTFIVPDRPNPLGGKIVEGPYHNRKGIFRHKIPLRHGMTYGEIASMLNETEGYGVDLVVVKMKGWTRDMLWEDTGLHWVMPSPNMDEVETAYVYPGQCLFERCSFSEGRGTTKPFLISGAPWIDNLTVAADLNGRGISGAIFRPVSYIPKGGRSPGDSMVMFHGVEIMLTDHHVFKSVEVSLHIIDAYKKSNPDSLKWTPPDVIKKLDEPGMTVDKVIALCQEEIRDFIVTRHKFLLYE